MVGSCERGNERTFGVPCEMGNFLANWGTVNLSRWSL